jgi:type IV pilus assembly protein PilM
MSLIRRNAKYGPIGLDLGAAGIKMVQLRDEGGRPALQAAAYEVIPPNPDPSARMGLVAELIRKALHEAPFRGRRVATALGQSEFQMKNLRLPRMPLDELSAAVEFEAQDRFNLGEGANFRFVPAGEVRHGNELKEEVIVFAARSETIDANIQFCESLGLIPCAMDVAPCAVARSFVRFLRRAEDEAAVNVFLDVGRSGSAIIITRGCELAFLKLLETGGRRFSEAVGDALGLGPAEADELRIQNMREQALGAAIPKASVPEEMRLRIVDAVRPHAESIGRDLQLCLRYFAVTFRGQRPDCLTLVGGEAHEPALKQVLAESMDVPQIVGHPLRGVRGLGAMAARDQRTLQPAWSVATGLALRGTPWAPGRDASVGGRPRAAAVA